LKSHALVIAWALAMTSLGAISLGSFQTAVILLAGLFCYDIFWVFGTDVMMTVATKIEAPVKFLYTAPPPVEGAEPRSYPFSVLGLGDVVIPGLFVRFMSKVDSVLEPQKFSYFGASTFAYGAGLLACFAVNEITHAGQPALLYLDPACIGSALAVGAANGQLNELWNFEEERENE
jgi:minor histocompatibility antigen H13